MEAIKYTVTNEETGNDDKEQIRCSKEFMGAPWQDGVMLLDPAHDAGQCRRNKFTTKSGLDIAYEPSARRVFGIVQLIFTYAGTLWLLVEKLEGEENRNKLPPWQSRIIPNWTHLRTLTTTRENAPASLSARLEVFPLDNVERVRIIVPDPNQPAEKPIREYWCPIDSDCVPFHESFDPGAKYERFGENDENGNPTTLFVDAINVQPWELCPPSAQAFSQASVGGAGMQAVYGPSASNLPVQQRDQPACPRNPTAS